MALNAGQTASGEVSDWDTPATKALAALLDSRFSCRGFRPDPVPQPVITRILGLAQRTASWCNSQPWQVVVTSGQATERFRVALYRHAAEHESEPDFPFPREYRGIYLERRRTCGFQLYEAVGVARGDRAAGGRQAMENFRLFGAPHVAIITTDEALGVYGAVDCGSYVGNFVLAAQSMGVATIAQAALARHSKFVRAHFGLGDDRMMVCGISFGFEDASHPANRFRTSRASIEDAVTRIDE
ncbi:MAG TPA: nitroreductase [Candidatus Cybelea sp.]|nr:nitroreductase [Candidatus Cybelea sp.]